MDNRDIEKSYKSIDEIADSSDKGKAEFTAPAAKSPASSSKDSGSGEHHHHHHHHHHHSSSSCHHSSHSGKKKKWYQDSRKLGIAAVIVAVVIIIAIVIGIVSVNKRNNVSHSGQNYCSFSLVENAVSFNGNKVDKIYIKYGNWDADINENTADYILRLSDSFTILYNGDYTGTYLFDDGSTEIFHFSYNQYPQPITLSEDGGQVQISVNHGYRVNYLYYTYGQTLGDPYARYISLDENAQTAVPLGNGIHTFRINATGDEGTSTYYVAIDVKGCQKPAVIVQDEIVGLFAYGFNVSSVSYTAGNYNSWAEMQGLDSLYYAMCNSNLDRSDFGNGAYTFCFRTDSKDYIIHAEL